MGMIQQNINQGLSIAGFMYSQTGQAKAQQEKRALHKEYQAQTKLIDAIEKDVTVPNKDGFGRNYTKTSIPQMEEVLAAEKARRTTAEKLYKLEGGKDDSLLNETGGGIDFMEGLIKERVQKEATEKATKEAAEQKAAEEKQMNEQSAAASNVIQSALKDPFSIADTELQKAIETKRRLNERKGGMML